MDNVFSESHWNLNYAGRLGWKGIPASLLAVLLGNAKIWSLREFWLRVSIDSLITWSIFDIILCEKKWQCCCGVSREYVVCLWNNLMWFYGTFGGSFCTRGVRSLVCSDLNGGAVKFIVLPGTIVEISIALICGWCNGRIVLLFFLGFSVFAIWLASAIMVISRSFRFVVIVAEFLICLHARSSVGWFW